MAFERHRFSLVRTDKRYFSPLFLACLLAYDSESFTTGLVAMEARKSFWDPAKRAANAAELFGLIADGTLKMEINQRYQLSDVAQAHTDVEARKTTGSTVLMP